MCSVIPSTAPHLESNLIVDGYHKTSSHYKDHADVRCIVCRIRTHSNSGFLQKSRENAVDLSDPAQ
jgi:hypothetical protein